MEQGRRAQTPAQIEQLESRVLLAATPQALLASGLTASTYPLARDVAVQSNLSITGLSAIAKSPRKVQLTWSTASAAIGYRVLRSLDGVTFLRVATLSDPQVHTYADKGLTSCTTYTYKVRAFSESRNGPVSAPVAVTTPLVAPVNVGAAAVAPTQVQVTWLNADPATRRIVLLRSVDGVTFSTVNDSLVPTATSYLDSVASGRTYVYALQAVRRTVTSARSLASPVTTSLIAVSALSAAATTPTSVRLSWSGNDPSATGFYVSRSADGGAYARIATVGSGSATSYLDRSVSAVHPYSYKVQAFSALSTSAMSAAATVTTPRASVVSLVAAPRASTGVQLTWTDVDSAAKYRILRATDNVHFSELSTLTSPGTRSYADTAVVSGQAYAYRIEAYVGSAFCGASNNASAIPRPAAPSALTAAGLAPTHVQLHWMANDRWATGYSILRSTDNAHFTVLTTLTSGATVDYSDATVVTGGTHYYRVQAFVGTVFSAVSNTAWAAVPPAAPSGLSADVQSPTSIQIQWTDNDPDASGYRIMRSTDGATFSAIATIGSATATTYTDTSVLSGHKYHYRVRACAGAVLSAASNTVSATTPLIAPSDLSTAIQGSSVKLQWTSNDAAAVGFRILRSTDGLTFSCLTEVGFTSITTYSDSAVFGGQTYTYRIQAYNADATSPESNSASATTTIQGATSVTTRYAFYSPELVVNSTGTSDSISVAQADGLLSVTLNGQITNYAVPAAGLFIYTRGGADSVTIDASVSVRTTVETIDYANTTINSAGTNVSIWMDASDAFNGTGTAHRVTDFAGNVSKGLWASLPNPSDLSMPYIPSYSLWGTGPVAADVNQGGAGDCYYLAGLAAFAATNPTFLQETAVDMGDGTYTIQFYHMPGTPSYARVSNIMAQNRAQIGPSHNIWALVMEKAFCYIRGGQNTYSSLWGGYELEAFLELQGNYNTFGPSSYDDADLYNFLSGEIADGHAIALSSSGAGGLLADHSYSLISVYKDESGVNHYVVRNPWGPGHYACALEDFYGIADLNYGQFVANFYSASESV